MTLDEHIMELVRKAVRDEVGLAVRDALSAHASNGPSLDEELTTAQVGDLAGREPETVCEWIRLGLLRAVQGPPYRIRRADFEEFRKNPRRRQAEESIDIDELAREVVRGATG